MPNEVDLESVCKSIFGFSSRRYRQLAEEGFGPKPKKGKIDFVLAAKGVIDYYRRLSAGEGDLTLTDVRKKLVQVTADLKKTELDMRRGDLVPRGNAEKWAQDVLIHFKERLFAYPRRGAGELYGKEPADIEIILQKNISDIFSEVYFLIKKQKGGKEDGESSQV